MTVSWPTISSKFKSEHGLYWNERLANEIVKRRNYSQSRRNNASKIKNKKIESYAEHMENENESENKIENKNGNFADSAELMSWPTFNDFWELYDKEVNKKESRRHWTRLSQKEKENIIEYLPVYRASNPQKKYRKNPDNFIRERIWENELINYYDKKNGEGNNSQQQRDQYESILGRTL